MEKNKVKFKERGVTLIALVITIIVLLILAGVALAALTGDSGILTNSEKAKEDTLKANAKEKVQIAIMEYKVGQNSEGKTLKEYLEAAGATELSPGGNKGIIDGHIFQIKNGEVIVTKGTSYELTLQDVYTEEMIGQAINYIPTKELPDDVEWIVIGQDEDGNVLATTNRPLGMSDAEADYRFTVAKGAAEWLMYEDALNTKCAELFGGIVQGKIVDVGSMNIDHVNALTGFIEPEFNTYKFGSTEQKEAGTVDSDCWHPDLNGTATAQDAYDESEDPTRWSKAEISYEYDTYWYGEKKWECLGNEADYTGTLDNLDFILGPSTNRYCYMLATRSVAMASGADTGAGFCVGMVGKGHVGTWGGLEYLGYTYMTITTKELGFYNLGQSPQNMAIRPVVSLSSEFIVEEKEDGTYKLVENEELNLSVLERYILGQDGQGINADNIVNPYVYENGLVFTFIDNEIITDASTSIIFVDYDLYEHGQDMYMYMDMEYKGEMYRIHFNKDVKTIKFKKMTSN